MIARSYAIMAKFEMPFSRDIAAVRTDKLVDYVIPLLVPHNRKALYLRLN